MFGLIAGSDIQRIPSAGTPLNCTAHADVEQSDGGTLSTNQTMIEHTPHAIQLMVRSSVVG